MSKVLEKPACKVFLKHLSECKEIIEPGNSCVWSTCLSGQSVKFYVVTVQGTIVETQKEGDGILLDDGTAVALVKGCSKIPFQASKLIKGQYVMAAGQLQKTGPCPQIRVTKLQNLSDNNLLSTMWPLEVIDGIFLNRDLT
ncbi:RecQ mediated genome instability 2 [Mactra antiquata]